METFIIFFIILGAISGLSEGAGILPIEPESRCLNEAVTFITNLSPAEEPFLSVGWSLGADIPIITSLLDRNLSVPEYENRITLFRSTGSLVLRNLKLNESGEYRVSILPAADFQKTGSIKLDVHERVSVTVTPQSLDLVEFNSSAHLSCSSSGSSSSFLWMNSSSNSEVTESDRVQINSTEGVSTLTIVNVSRFDHGLYKCVLPCPIGDLPEANLSVSFGPDNIRLTVTASDNSFMEGSDVTLTCSVDSRPAAEFIWFLNGEQLDHSGPELQLMNVQMSQIGDYSCQAFNSKTQKLEISQPSTVSVYQSSGLSGGAIAGIVIACLVVVAAVGTGVYYGCKKSKEKKKALQQKKEGCKL